jgi:hypothetical protein
VPAPEALRGTRVVAGEAAIDTVLGALPTNATGLRFAPDEALILGTTGIVLDIPDAIVEDEAGFVALTVDRAIVERHTEWSLPEPGAVAQGSIAGVPCKLAWLPDGQAWIVTHAAYVDELLDRLR